MLYTRYRLPVEVPGNLHLWANAAVESSGGIGPPQSSSKAIDRYLISSEMWDLSMGLSFVDKSEKLQLSFVVNNLLNKRTMDQVLAVSEGFLGVIGGYNKPRTWGLVFTWSH